MNAFGRIADAGAAVLPPAASAAAGQVDSLFVTLLAICGALLIALLVLVVCFAVRYRAGGPRPHERPPAESTSHWVEGGIAAVLAVLFLGLFVWAGRLYLDMFRGPEQATTIDVVGKQWMWKIYHGNGAREINALHVPVDRDIRLRITSEDVIHSFSVPALRLKRDAVPGMQTFAWFRANRPGRYHLFCAEFCGTDHARMTGAVIVMSADDYRRWLAARAGGTVGPAGTAQGSR